METLNSAECSHSVWGLLLRAFWLTFDSYGWSVPTIITAALTWFIERRERRDALKQLDTARKRLGSMKDPLLVGLLTVLVVFGFKVFRPLCGSLREFCTRCTRLSCGHLQTDGA